MQVLDVQPTNPTPYTPVGGSYNNNPVPGAGGLPSLSGLTRNMNPMAQQLQQQGRGEDSVLVHMTPGEVNSLRGLAQAFGGDLTQNPNTGLPEAGWLGKLLPTLIGFGLNFIPGVGPLLAAGITAAGATAVTGDLKQGLMAGLGAYGGASLGTAVGLGTGAAKAAAPALVGTSGATGVTMPSIGITSAGSAVPTSIGAGALGGGAVPTSLSASTLSSAGAGLGASIPSLSPAVTAPLNLAGNAVGSGAKGIIGKFGAAAREGLKAGTLPYKVAPYAAGLGLTNTVSQLSQPNLAKYDPNSEKNTMPYEGPYRSMPRRLHQTVTGPGEIQYFDEVNPIGYLTASGERRGYADGGEAESADAARAKYLNAFDERLKGVTGLSDVNQKYVQDLRAELANPLSAMDQQGNRVAVSLPQLNAIRSGVFERLEGALRENQGAPAAPAAPPPAAKPLTLSGLPALTDTTKTTVTDTATPTSNTVTDRSTTTLSPATTQSGYGVERLADTYTPQFTSKADYVTPKNPAYTLGSQLAAQLPAYANMFQTSPGPITASRTYPGGSPSERIRAAAQANAAAAASAPRTSNEVDYGFAKSAGLTPTMSNAAVADWNSIMAQYGYNPNPTYNYADGGEIHMDDGAFVVDARTVSELGNGSSNAGIELLERLGGHAVRGPGDGVSDSVPANIGGKQEARVARDEVIFPAATVKRLGGAKKLYALMDKAHKARKKAGRGEDTGLRKGLA